MKRARGLTLIELMIALAIVGVLAAIAYPSYRDHIVRASRVAAQGELLELSSIQEKIYLNSNAYSADVTAAYNGTAAGGLGKTSGKSDDGKYAIALSAVTGQSYTLTATPVAGTPQASDGAFSISSTGARTCSTPAPAWCKNGVW
jgi:type IV pilus assembly protein PilE